MGPVLPALRPRGGLWGGPFPPPGRAPLVLRGYNRNALGRQQRIYAHSKNAYRSGLEEKIAGQIAAAGLDCKFESFKLAYTVPESKHTYTPDMSLPNGIVLETKGLFQTDDRKKMKLIRQQYPDIDIRFIFSNAKKRIAPKSPTTYAKWAEDNGFKWAHRDLPKEWLTEPPNKCSLAALTKAAILAKPRLLRTAT